MNGCANLSPKYVVEVFMAGLRSLTSSTLQETEKPRRAPPLLGPSVHCRTSGHRLRKIRNSVPWRIPPARWHRSPAGFGPGHATSVSSDSTSSHSSPSPTIAFAAHATCCCEAAGKRLHKTLVILSRSIMVLSSTRRPFDFGERVAPPRAPATASSSHRRHTVATGMRARLEIRVTTDTPGTPWPSESPAN